MTAHCEEISLSVFYQNAIKEAAKAEKFEEFAIVATKYASKGDGFMGDIYRITVKGVKEDGSMDSLKLILKTSPNLKQKRDLFSIQLLYKREIYAYSKLFPQYDLLQEQYNVPKTERFQYAKLFNAINEEFNELLIFEDLNNKGFIMYGKQNPLDYDHLLLLVKNLARFHAISIVLKAKNLSAFEEIVLQISNRLEFNDNILLFMETIGDKLSPIIEDEDERRKTVSYLKNVVKEMKCLLNSETAAPYNVICHGDCWNNNFLFKYKDGKVVDLRMVDYQVIRYASPVTDLAYMIFLGTDKALRDNHYEELLTIYYETLSSTVALMGADISKHFPENVYRKQIEKFMAIGFIVACSILPVILADSEAIPELEDIIENKPAGEYTYCDVFIERIRDIIKFSIEKRII